MERGDQKRPGTRDYMYIHRQNHFRQVTRMESSRLTAVAPYGKEERTRSRGRQPKKWMDSVKEELRAQGINKREAVDNSSGISIISRTSPASAAYRKM